MKRQKTPSFWAMLKNSFFWRFLHENGMKRNPIHAAETHSSNQHRYLPQHHHRYISQNLFNQCNQAVAEVKRNKCYVLHTCANVLS